MVGVGLAQLVDLCLDACVAAEAALGGVFAVCAGFGVLIQVSVDIVDMVKG